MKVKEIKNSGLSVVKLGPRNRSLTRLFLCLYLSLNLVFPLGQVRAEEACRPCEQEPQADLKLPDKFNLVFYQSVDPVIPPFLEKITTFKSGPWGMFNKSFFDRTDKGSGRPFLVHHSNFELAVSAIENLVQGDQSYEQISKIDEATGGVSVSGEFSGRLPSNSPEQVPRPDLDYRIKWVSIFGATYLFREVSVQEPVGQVAYLQLFGWVPETWGKPTWSKEKRCIEFVNAKIIEPTVNASLQTMVSVTHEGLKVVLPGYSGAAMVSEGKQIILGMFETAIGLATLGFMGKLNTMRKAVAWTVIGLSAGQLAAAIMYEPTVGQVAGAAIPAVLAIPYTLPVTWTRQVAAGGLIWYQMVVNSDKVDARILKRFNNLQELVSTSHALGVSSLNSSTLKKIHDVTWAIALENQRNGQGLTISLNEGLLVKQRIEAMDQVFYQLINSQRVRPDEISYDYFMKQLHINRFAKFWAAWNRFLRVGIKDGNGNWKEWAEGRAYELNIHIWFNKLVLKLLPNGQHLDPKARLALLEQCIKNPAQAEKKIIDAGLDFITFGPDGGAGRELISDFVKNLQQHGYEITPNQIAATLSREILMGFLSASGKLPFPVYRIVAAKRVDGVLKPIQYVAGEDRAVDIMKGGIQATGISAKGVTTFAGAHDMNDPEKTFIILKYGSGKFSGTPATGEGGLTGVFQQVKEQHGNNAVPNEIVLATPDGKLGNLLCHVESVLDPTQKIPVYEFIPVP